MELNFKTFGEGDPVIILHGLFGMLDNWQTFAKALSKKYMVYLVDQRDHGRSPHTDEFNYTLLAEDLKNFMDQNWLYEARLIGHSMGGKTLLEFAKHYDDEIEQMLIVDMGIKSYPGGHETIIESMLTAPIHIAENRRDIDTHLSKYIKDQGVRQFLMKNLQRDVGNGGFKWKMNLELLSKEYPNILSAIEYDDEISVDTLFVYGSQSSYIEKRDINEIKNTFTNSKFESIDAGHWIHAEKPKELLKVTLDFFENK